MYNSTDCCINQLLLTAQKRSQVKKLKTENLRLGKAQSSFIQYTDAFDECLYFQILENEIAFYNKTVQIMCKHHI